MKQAPQKVHAEKLYDFFSPTKTQSSTMAQIDGRYVPARGMGYFGLRSRFKLALDVFKGKADALYWHKQ